MSLGLDAGRDGRGETSRVLPRPRHQKSGNTSSPLRVHSARMVLREMLLSMNRTAPSMNRKLPPPRWPEWKLAGLPLGELRVYCRLWTTTAVIDGRQFWHGG